MSFLIFNYRSNTFDANLHRLIKRIVFLIGIIISLYRDILVQMYRSDSLEFVIN